MWAIIKFKKKLSLNEKRAYRENSGKTNACQPLIKVQKKSAKSSFKEFLSLEIIFSLIKILQTKILFTH